MEWFLKVQYIYLRFAVAIDHIIQYVRFSQTDKICHMISLIPNYSIAQVHLFWIHCDLVMPFNVMDPGQHWLR